MRRTGLAFRLRLSLLLVLNGIGSAVAGVRMAMPAMTDVAVQEAAANASLPPCHQAAMADAMPAMPMPPVLAPLALALPPPAVRIAPHPSPPRHQPDRPPIA